jgi:hypothetical protein
MDLGNIHILMEQSIMDTGVKIVGKEMARLLIRMETALKVFSRKISRKVTLNLDSGALMVLLRVIS